ncbi:MAG: TrmJ/YjtD family RNA methyltransferase [archaeon]|nr:TrmJ/YjtD family RNA methyltransferase [archaeon]
MLKKKDFLEKSDNLTIQLKKQFSNIKFSIILIETEGSANIGSISRTMKNFGFKKLILFNPKCSIDSDARKYSMHARKDILEKREQIDLDSKITREEYIKKLKDFLSKFNYVIGTSAKTSMFRNIKRINYYIDELDFSIINSEEEVKIALLFGREPSGLMNEEIELCDFIVRIPTSDEYSSLNLSHAVTIVLFTIFKKIYNIGKGTITPSTREQRELLYKKIAEVVEYLEFSRDVDDRIIRTIKNVLGRSFSSMKEVNMLLTLFKQIENIEKIKKK